MTTAPFVARPQRLLVHVAVWTVVLTGGALLGWFAMAPHIRALFTPLQIGTLLLFLAVMLGIIWACALSVVREEADGLVIRNGLRTHRVPWAAADGVRFSEHDAFAYVLLRGDLDRVLAMGIMRSDGVRATRLAQQLNDLIARRLDA